MQGCDWQALSLDGSCHLPPNLQVVGASKGGCSSGQHAEFVDDTVATGGRLRCGWAFAQFGGPARQPAAAQPARAQAAMPYCGLTTGLCNWPERAVRYTSQHVRMRALLPNSRSADRGGAAAGR